MGQHLCDLPVIGDLSHLYQRMRVFVSFQKVLEGWAGACQDHFVSFNLLAILTGQGHISEVIVFSKISKGTFCILFEVYPLHA